GTRGRRGRRVSLVARPASLRPPRDVLHGDVDGDTCCASSDSRRRPARFEHAGISAGEDKGHGGPLPKPSERRGAETVLSARREGRQGQICAGNSAHGLTDPQAFAGCADGRARHHTEEGLAAGAYYFLVVPHHGRHRILDVRSRTVEPMVPLAWHAVP